jgi:hypothetical protein
LTPKYTLSRLLKLEIVAVVAIFKADDLTIGSSSGSIRLQLVYGSDRLSMDHIFITKISRNWLVTY